MAAPSHPGGRTISRPAQGHAIRFTTAPNRTTTTTTTTTTADGTTTTTITTADGEEIGFFPIQEEVVDFFSTGEGGIFVDSASNVAFASSSPTPGGRGSNSCGVVLSCSPGDGAPPPDAGNQAPGVSDQPPIPGDEDDD